jgi:hypothetical protein
MPTNSQTSVIDLNLLNTAAEVETAINAEIDVLEGLGFVVTECKIARQDDIPGAPQVAYLIGVLPAFAGDSAGLGLVKTLTLSVAETDITAAAALETLDFASALPEGSYILGSRIGLSAIFTGGTISDYTVDLGFPANLDAIVDDADLFAAAIGGEASTSPAGVAHHMLVTGSEAARTPSATFRCGSDDVADATAGACTLTLIYA